MTPEEWETLTDDEKADDLKRALDGIADEIREETKRSRFRDGWSRAKVHPIKNDFNKLLDFLLDRCRHSPRAVFDAARVVLRPENGNLPQAIRLVVSVVLAPGVRGGSCGWFMRRRCARLTNYADQLDQALAYHAEWKRSTN
jgi:hypothetical protein